MYLLGALGLVRWTRPRGFVPTRKQVPWEYVREPALVLMWAWIGVSICFILSSWFLTYFATIAQINSISVRLSLVVMLTLLLAVAVWVRKRYAHSLLRLVPAMPAQLALFTIVLSIALPLLIDPWLIMQLLTHAYVMDPSTFNSALERDGLSTFVRDLPKGETV